MIKRMREVVRKLYLDRLIRRGLRVGTHFQMEKGSNIDANFPWLITIGNNVTLSSDVYLTAHDGASQKVVGYSRVGKVIIEDNVFIGAKSVVMPNVRIGRNSIIGAGSVVCADIPADVVAAGSPAVVIMNLEEYREKNRKRMEKAAIYEKEYTLAGGVNDERKEQMRRELEPGMGFIV